MSEFREAMEQFHDALLAEGNQIPGLHTIIERKRARTKLRLSWSAAAMVVLMLGTIPFYVERQRARADELLLQQVNAGLSRPVARALTALMGN